MLNYCILSSSGPGMSEYTHQPASLIIIALLLFSFKSTWSGDKNRFIVRFRDTNPGVADFDATFARYNKEINSQYM